MKVNLVFIIFLYGCLLIFAHLPFTYAGSFMIAPTTIYGTSITVSVSYPSSFHFDEPTNISITITVNFYNESISAVNITAIHVRLYNSNANLTEKVGYQPPTLQDCYAYAEWLSTDYYGGITPPPSTPLPHKIERLSTYVNTGYWDLSLPLIYQFAVNQEVQAKLFVQVTLCFLDIKGETIWRTKDFWEIGYHWVLFSGEGEAPIVTVYPKSEQHFWLLKPETIAIIIAFLGLVSAGTFVIYKRRKRKLSN